MAGQNRIGVVGYNALLGASTAIGGADQDVVPVNIPLDVLP